MARQPAHADRTGDAICRHALDTATARLRHTQPGRRGLVPDGVGWADIIRLIQSSVCANLFPDKSGPTEAYTTR